MRKIFPSIKTKPTFTLNFALAYIGVIVLEISVAGTELLKLYPESKTEVIEVRVIHGIFAFALIFATKLILKARKIEKTGYIGLALVGLWIAIPSLLFRIFLMENFDLITNSQIQSFFAKQFFVSLIQAFFWIPVVIILGGQRILILEAFKKYEKRLIISGRKEVRESHDFIVLKKEVDYAFRNELIINTSLLLNSLNSSDDKKLSLKERNEIMQRCLRENVLRELSQRLNQKSEAVDRVSNYEQDIRSLNLIRKQFNILFNFTARKEPLPAWVYTLLSFAILLPTYINFYTVF